MRVRLGVGGLDGDGGRTWAGIFGKGRDRAAVFVGPAVFPFGVPFVDGGVVRAIAPVSVAGGVRVCVWVWVWVWVLVLVVVVVVVALGASGDAFHAAGGGVGMFSFWGFRKKGGRGNLPNISAIGHCAH